MRFKLEIESDDHFDKLDLIRVVNAEEAFKALWDIKIACLEVINGFKENDELPDVDELYDLIVHLESLSNVQGIL